MDERQLHKLIEQAGIPGLLEVFEELNRTTREAVLTALETRLTEAKKKQAVRKIKAATQVVDSEVRNWLPETLQNAYIGAMGFVSVRLGKTLTDGLTGVHEEAINALISNAYLDFAGGMNNVVRSAEHQINEALKRQIRAQIIAGELRGDAVREIADEVEDLLKQQGFTALIDRGGRHWSLVNYADMLSHTHVISSANTGTINRMAELGVDIVEVSSHGATDALCAPHEGKIYSISGNSSHYPQGKLPSYHVRCKHSILPRPDLS